MKLPLRLTLVAALAAPASFALAQSNAPDAVDAPRARRGGGPGMHRGRRGRHGMHFRRILEDLNLTDNQKTQIRAIFESARERRQELRGQGRTPEAREARHALHQETKRLVEEVLTPAQRTQAQRLRREHMQRHLQRRVDRMATRLSLTDAQKTAVTRIFENAGNRRRALHQNGNMDRDAMRSLHEQTRTELSGVLSAEQMTQLREMRSEHRGRHGRRGRRGPRGNGNGGVAPIRNAAP